nr:hypothetical protein [Tanacetum cinerariifolium]
MSLKTWFPEIYFGTVVAGNLKITDIMSSEKEDEDDPSCEVSINETHGLNKDRENDFGLFRKCIRIGKCIYGLERRGAHVLILCSWQWDEYDERYEECTCVLYKLSSKKIVMIKKVKSKDTSAH